MTWYNDQVTYWCQRCQVLLDLAEGHPEGNHACCSVCGHHVLLRTLRAAAENLAHNAGGEIVRRKTGSSKLFDNVISRTVQGVTIKVKL